MYYHLCFYFLKPYVLHFQKNLSIISINVINHQYSFLGVTCYDSINVILLATPNL